MKSSATKPAKAFPGEEAADLVEGKTAITPAGVNLTVGAGTAAVDFARRGEAVMLMERGLIRSHCAVAKSERCHMRVAPFSPISRQIAPSALFARTE